MAQQSTFRCWYRDGSARLINATLPVSAQIEAQKAAQEDAGPAPTDKTERKRWRDSWVVAKVEDMSNGGQVVYSEDRQ